MLRSGRVLGGIADLFIGGDVTNFFDVFGFDVSMTSTFGASASLTSLELTDISTIGVPGASVSSDFGVD